MRAGVPILDQPAQPHDACRALAAVVDTINCGFVSRDAKGTITFANQRLLGWLGYEWDEVVGQHAQKLVPPDLGALVLEEMHAVDAGDLRARLTTLQRHDSTTFPVLTIPQRFYDDVGELAGAFVVIIDLGTVQTAKRAGYGGREDVRSSLERIAMELQSISLSADIGSAVHPSLDHDDLAALSPREREVLAHIVAGERVPAIATQLQVSQHTVRSHLKSIFRKVGVKNQAELVARVRSLER